MPRGTARLGEGLGALFKTLGAGPALRQQAQEQREKDLLSIALGQARLDKTGLEADLLSDRYQARQNLEQSLGKLFAGRDIDPGALASAARAADRLSLSDISRFTGGAQEQDFRRQAVEALSGGDPVRGQALLAAGGRTPLTMTRVGEDVAYNPLLPPQETAIRELPQVPGRTDRTGGASGVKALSSTLAKVFMEPVFDSEGNPAINPMTGAPITQINPEKLADFLIWWRESGINDMNVALSSYLQRQQSQETKPADVEYVFDPATGKLVPVTK